MAAPVATTTHFGPCDALQDAYGALRWWQADGGRHQSGPHWEVYYTDPTHEPDSSRWRTDVYMPFAVADEPATAHS